MSHFNIEKTKISKFINLISDMKKKNRPNSLDELEKKRVKSHRNGARAVKYFKEILPDTEKEDLIFTDVPQQEDYGVDGIMQLFKLEKHTGEFFHVQIKGIENAEKYIEKLEIPYSLELKDARFLLEKTKEPTALIVVDLATKSVYWVDIQTNTTISLAYQNSLDHYLNNQKSIDTPTFTINVNKTAILPDTFSQLYDYFAHARALIAEKIQKETLKKSTLPDAISKLKELEEHGLDLPGMKAYYRGQEPIALQSLNPIYTIHQEGKTIDYYPTPDFVSENAPIVNFKVQIANTPENQDRIETLKKLKSNLTEVVSLEFTGDEIVDLKSTASGRDIMGDFLAKGGNPVLRMSNQPSSKSQTLFLRNNENNKEVILNVKVWIASKNLIKIQTDDDINQFFKLDCEIEIKKKENTKFTLQINKDFETDVITAFEHLKFLEEIQSDLQLHFIFNGTKQQMASLEVTRGFGINKKELEILEALKNIMLKTGKSIRYSTLKDLTNEEYNNIFRINRLLNGEQIQLKKYTAKATLATEKITDFDENKFVQFRMSPPELYLFGEPLVLTNYDYISEGKVIKSTVLKQAKKSVQYELVIDEGKESIEYKTTS